MKKNLLAVAAITFLTMGACIQTGTNHKSIEDQIEGITSNDKYVSIVNKSFDGSSVNAVHADLVSSDISVIGDAAGQTTVEVFARGRGAESLSKEALNTRLNKYYEIIVQKNGGQVDIGIRYKRSHVPNNESLSFKFEVHTGSTVRSDIRTVSGDIVAGRLATTKAQSTSGDVELSTINGDVDAGTVSGDIKLDRITGSLSTNSTSGDIRATQIGKIGKAGTVSGDIEIDASGLDGNVALNTVSGDIRLTIPSKTGADISLSSVSGDLNLASFSNAEFKTKSKREVEATINGGGNEIKGSTVSGDITIKN